MTNYDKEKMREYQRLRRRKMGTNERGGHYALVEPTYRKLLESNPYAKRRYEASL